MILRRSAIALLPVLGTAIFVLALPPQKDPMKWDKAKAKNDPDLVTAMSMGFPPATMVVFDSRVIAPPAPQVKVPVEFLVNPKTIAGEEMKDGGRHFGLEFHVAAYSLWQADYSRRSGA